MSNKTIILITGANQGLGYECAKKLAREQPDYSILLGARSISKGTTAAESITERAPNTTVQPLELDITSDSSIAAAVEEVSSKYGRLDILFNNAGIARAGLESPRDEWAAILSTNVISQFMVTEAFVPLLKKSAFPKLVFMSSGLGSITDTLDPKFPYYSFPQNPYVVSKAAFNMLAAKYSVVFKEAGFKVNIICPGHRATNLNGYQKVAGKPEGGAIEACRIITQGRDGQYSTFSNEHGLLPW